MTLDPRMADLLQAMGEAPYVDLATLDHDAAMRIARPPRTFPQAAPDEALTVRDVAIPADAHTVPGRLYAPRSTDGGALLHLHGGGWVSGSIEGDDRRCRAMARDSGCAVLSVGYRLAPEDPYPAAVDDALAAWDWLRAQPGLGIDAARLGISGTSAGSQVALSAMLRLRAAGAALPRFQVEAYPAIDPAMGSASYRRFADGPFLTRARMAWFWRQYGGAAADLADPFYAPLEADVAGLPPALVVTAEYDVLRDEGVRYVEKLRAAGVVAEHLQAPGMLHGFLSLDLEHPQSRLALGRIAEALARGLGE